MVRDVQSGVEWHEIFDMESVSIGTLQQDAALPRSTRACCQVAILRIYV